MQPPAGRQLLAALPPAAPLPPPPAAPLPAVSTLQAVVGVLGSLAGSLHEGMSVPGEDPAVIRTDEIHLVAQLDSASGAGSRLFSQPLTAPGSPSSFAPLPPGALAGAGAGSGSVRTQFLSLAFNPWDTSAGAGGGSGGGGAGTAQLAPSLTRLVFGGADGGELRISGLQTPIKFTMPAPANFSDGSGAVCSFWDETRAAFDTAGCASLPSPAPANHTVAWRLPPAPKPAIPMPPPPSLNSSVLRAKPSPPLPPPRWPPPAPLQPPAPAPALPPAECSAAVADAFAEAFDAGKDAGYSPEHAIGAQWDVTGKKQPLCAAIQRP